MSTCIRCRRNYREPPDEQGDHDCPKCGLTPEQRERGEEEEVQHEAWVRRRNRRKAEPGEILCQLCGCGGNQECGHDPLGAPEHYCELDIGDQHEKAECYCCRKLIAAEAAGKEDE